MLSLRMRLAPILLAIALPSAAGCFLPLPRLDAAAPDAGTADDAQASPDATRDAACDFPESCPAGCNPTPCGCVTDNLAIECGQ